MYSCIYIDLNKTKKYSTPLSCMRLIVKGEKWQFISVIMIENTMFDFCSPAFLVEVNLTQRDNPICHRVAFVLKGTCACWCLEIICSKQKISPLLWFNYINEQINVHKSQNKVYLFWLVRNRTKWLWYHLDAWTRWSSERPVCVFR